VDEQRGAFFEQFIEDYFSECDEHLATARRVLLALEGATPGASWHPALRELQRSLHTLKGLSGMVEDVATERVAHALEDSLRGVEAAPALAGSGLLDDLFAGVDTLERCVAAHRAGAAPPPVDELIAMLSRHAGSREQDRGTRAPETARDRRPSDARSATGAVIHLFEFVPSAELTARGIGVDTIRARLRALGTMLDAKPRVVAGGVAFDFRVAVAGGLRPDDAWLDDGLRWTIEGVAPADAERGTDASASSDATAMSPTGGSGAGVVRVELGRLDDVMRLVGDLVVSRGRLGVAADRGATLEPSALLDLIAEIDAAMERQLRHLREGVMRIRLVPVGEVFERLRFAARDSIRESGKRVGLVFHGQSTEIDKVIVDRMLEPLLHLVRNAVSHGIERPDERRERGKPEEGTLTLRASASGDRIRLRVEDDGAGIDVERVARRARERGLLAADEALTADGLLDVLCAPGFSTRDEADRTSGRGVGMDVVRAAVRALAGELTVETASGAGTAFTIDLPLSLMIVDALLVDVSGQQMAVPQPALREIVQIASSSVVSFENNDAVSYRDGVLPIVHLAPLFGFPDSRPERCYLLVVGSDAAPIGLRVDRLIGLREIVVHPVADRLVAMPGISGATDLGNGRVSLILDVAAVLRLAEAQRDARTSARLTRPPAPPPPHSALGASR
jgi:two-component system chemotaxis sensor kinase CheA